MNLLSGLTGSTLNRYSLNIPSCSYSLDVEDFNGLEQISILYHYTIKFTSLNPDLTAEILLNKPATLSMGMGDLLNPVTGKVVHGVITHFRRISGSRDQVKYEIILEPYLALLDRQFRTHRFFVNKSVPEVVEQILQEHGLKDWEYEFTLKQTYPKREQINQYQETDLKFIERLLSEMGIFYFFTLQPDTQTEVVNFADKQSAYEFGKTLPLNSPSGMSDSGAQSVWGLSVHHNVVEASVTAKDYNYREAQKILQSTKADMTRGDGEGVTYGEVYHYKPRHLDTGDKIDPTAETGNFLARLDHERFLSAQTLITGLSTDPTLHPAQVLTVTDTSIPSTLPELLAQPMVVVRTGFSASRRDALKVTIAAVPYSETLCWRPALLPRPKVSGTMMARVTSAKSNDIYAWQDTSGLYRVKFDADQDDKAQGQESMPVRLAKPYGGDVYGIHFPLIQGTEVAIAFHDGDPDRPYIAHALHDSRHTDHVTEKNNTRNVIRTPAFNKLRMEDKRGEEHIKLSTEYGGKTQLNLGHNVDAQRVLRGEGAELRTDDWVAVRGGKGVFISADKQPSAGGEMLDMESAISLVKGAVNQVTEWGEITQSHHNLQPDIQSLSDYLKSADQLQNPAMLLNAPKGVGVVSPDVVMLQAGKALYAQSMGEVHIASTKRIALNASNEISLLAQNEGVRLVSGKGPFELESHADVISVTALKDIIIQSTQGHLQLTAKNGITLACGGAYIRMSPDGQIEIHGPGLLSLKGNHVLEGPASQDYPLPELPQSVCKECLQKAQQEAVGFVAR
ncbi:type VI secretion system tip protein VgrG [Yersinia massiliensis]|uniref:Type VI secretion system tip protein VgrG n=1 Tax=Yersinia massiliensis TaxID=419257 RepID=A0AA90XUQ8_9GAMM|nr:MULTISPECIES: type VI secretion system Vgr family protein [Yersinia]MDA5550351.1 type VI secretion system tip protein VgrG [Yersinia massiliensis]NIL28304.1 type VI secretion system tip protein VgrG [Yersinia massiliensis]PHZ22737.1 type VI secretion system tip protein VgrG [Yersinia massiliensis]UZM79775.1 type VI secretion system tip protein VgrG [Yersinia massiliensis]CFR30498.1 Rhs element Vgr protein [Yersinia frederiksenii]